MERSMMDRSMMDHSMMNRSRRMKLQMVVEEEEDREEEARAPLEYLLLTPRWAVEGLRAGTENIEWFIK